MSEVENSLDATPDPVKLIRIQVDGRQIAEPLPRQGGGFAPGTLKFPVPLSKGANAIRLAAVHETGKARPRRTDHDAEFARLPRGARR